MKTTLEAKKLVRIPTHVAIIMDGNGRWAKQRGIPRHMGHRAGTENIRTVVETFADYQVKYLTLYAFSTETWKRPRSEIQGLMRILSEKIDQEIDSLHKNGARLLHLGRLDRLPEKLREKIHRAIELTKNNTKITLSIAFDYGGRIEILTALQRIIEEGVSPQELNETLFGNYLYTASLPDPDLIIRTGGEIRLSNFLLWQSAYSELYFTPVLWPDFGREEIEKALLAYSVRERRFGGLPKEKSKELMQDS